MTIIDALLSPPAPAHSGLLHRYREALVRAFRHTTEEWVMKRAIAELQGLDDHMLRDIGLTRSEIESRVRHGQRNRYRD